MTAKEMTHDLAIDSGYLVESECGQNLHWDLALARSHASFLVDLGFCVRLYAVTGRQDLKRVGRLKI